MLKVDAAGTIAAAAVGAGAAVKAVQVAKAVKTAGGVKVALNAKATSVASRAWAGGTTEMNKHFAKHGAGVGERSGGGSKRKDY